MRLTAAFADAGIGSSAALYVLVATLYRSAPEWLSHALRVGIVARRISEELGLDERTIADIERAALIGNLGRLVLCELRGADGWDLADLWSLGEQARIAADIVSGAPFLRTSADIVRGSRECFDGSGFPQRLSGTAIPLGARILHLAEAVDSLRSLCAALGVSASTVHVEIVRCAGTRLDPDVVAAWLRCSEGPPRGILPGVAPQERHF
jgi:putative two-component system response regulator